MSDTAPDTGTPDSPVVTTDQLPSPDTGMPEINWQQEAEKWKGLAQKHEARAKTNATAANELDQLRKATMSEQEKAVAEARAAADREAAVKYGARLVDAEVRAAAAGRNIDVAALLEGVDRSRFLDDDGEPLVKEITAWLDRVAPVAEATPAGFPDLGQGNRGTPALALNDPLLKDLVAKVGGPRK